MPDITGQTWDTTQLQQDFEVVGFMAPFVVVKRRADGIKGTLEFTHAPRVYFDFTPGKRVTSGGINSAGADNGARVTVRLEYGGMRAERTAPSMADAPAVLVDMFRAHGITASLSDLMTGRADVTGARARAWFIPF